MTILATEIKEHAHVHSSDGHHVGRVDKVVGDKIELAKLDIATGFKHRYIPLDWIATVDGDKIVLSLTGDEAKERWTDEA